MYFILLLSSLHCKCIKYILNNLKQKMISILKMNEEFQSYHQPKMSHKSITSISSNSFIKPPSREDIIKSAGLIYPQSTSNKIVFISNSQGNGFRTDQMPQNMHGMKKQIDNICYLKWKENKQNMEKLPLYYFHTFIHLIYAIMFTLIAVLFTSILAEQDWDNFIQAFVWLGLAFTVISTVIAFFIFSRQSKSYNYDQILIKSIKNKLANLNMQQKMTMKDRPRFQWSCNKLCTWIAIEFMN